MKIDNTDVEYVAKLARLRFSYEEIEILTHQLNDILMYMEEMNALETEGVEPTSHVLSISNVFRKDEIKGSLNPEESLKNAPFRKDTLFQVPKIID